MVWSSVIFVLIFLVYLQFKAGTEAFARNTYYSNANVVKFYIKDTVDNIINEINSEREFLRKLKPNMTDTQINIEVKHSITEQLHNSYYSNEAYISVKEIWSYAGGDNYARRIIHPDRKTEGMMLSTSMTDSKGKKFYESELYGILNDGQLFMTYYYPKLNSDEITEKLGYSRLYKDFDWIISMGVNLDELDVYVDMAKEEVRPVIIRNLVYFFIWIAILLLVSLLILRHFDYQYFSSKQSILQRQIDYDRLTGANSRYYGIKLLNKEFMLRKHGETDTAVIMIDIDHFKDFNDRYGHELGDKVLKAVVRTLKATAGEENHIIRWGGDEFIAVLKNTRPDILQKMIEKLLEGIRQIEIKVSGEIIHVSTSMGASYFRISDNDYKNVLSRADRLLYQSKEQGRNRGIIEDELCE